MSRGILDLRLSIFEGPTPSIGALMLYAHLRAEPGVEPGRSAEYLVLCRDAPGAPPSRGLRCEVPRPEVARLVALLDAAGLPGRTPRVVANDSLLGEGPYLAFSVRARGRVASIDLPMQNAGFSGDDAGPLRAVLLRLADLVPAARRPAVRDVVERLAIDRAPGPGPRRFLGGKAVSGLPAGGRHAADRPDAPSLAAGPDGERLPPPAVPRGVLADH